MNPADILQKAVSQVKYRYLMPLLAEKADFPYAVVKGEPLSVMAFGAPGRRRSGDIDILVDKQDVRRLEALLTQAGFSAPSLSRQEQIVARAFSHQVPPYRKELPMGPLEVDVNYELVWGEWPGTQRSDPRGRKPSVSAMLSRCITMEIYGQPVPALAVDDAFLQLCLHHYKDMNSLYHLTLHNSITRKAFEDVRGFWERQKERINREWIEAWLEEYELTPYIYYMVRLTAQICQLPDLAAWADHLESEEGQALLDCYGLIPQERKHWTMPIGQRLDQPDIPERVRASLSEQDRRKTEQNYRIFGGL